jgi:4-diphosphocytidyl-2-C-methyl-D-erythritol kinase
MSGLTLRCPAKVNLYLKVVGRRPDGYHDLLTIMQPLTLADTLTLTLGAADITCACHGADLPQDEGNLAVRAARAFQQATGDSFGVHLQLIKRIPVAAGLGGGSSNAAGVLRGLNQLRGQPLKSTQLVAVARQLGADVPFFLLEGPALGQGIGDLLTPITLPPWWYVLLNPGFAVSTGQVYTGLRPPFAAPAAAELLAQLHDPPDRWLHNDLESVTLAQHPELVALKAALRQEGALGVLMSGSGPTVFGIFPDESTARQAGARLQARTGLWTAVTQGVA